mgnify:FL=1
MEDNNYGMNLFLDDEFLDDENLNLENENGDEPEIENEEIDEDVNQDEVVEEAEDEETDQNDDETSSPPLYKSLASHLYDKGILASVDSSKIENVKTPEDLEALVIEQMKANEYKDLTDTQKEALEAFRNGVSVETFKQQKEIELELESITEEAIESDESLRRQIIHQGFINKGYSEDKALKLTNRSFEVGEDLQDSKDALEDIKLSVKERFTQQQEYEKNLKIQKEEEQKKQRELLENSILKTEEPIKGIKLNEITRKKVLDTMFVPVSKNPKTGEDENALMKAQREEKDFAQKLYTVFTLSKGFKDFSIFGKQEKTNTINQLEKALKNNQHVLTGGDPSFIDDLNAFDQEIGDKLVY